MSGTQDQPPDPALDREAFLNNKTEVLVKLAETVQTSLGMMKEMVTERQNDLRVVTDDIIPILNNAVLTLNKSVEFTGEIHKIQKELSADLNKMRGLMLGKIDGLQGTMDLVRQDVRNSWQTADYAINNSSNVHDEVKQLRKIISTMQTQYQLLASHVEVLRRSADEEG